MVSLKPSFPQFPDHFFPPIRAGGPAACFPALALAAKAFVAAPPAIVSGAIGFVAAPLAAAGGATGFVAATADVAAGPVAA
jgi:hypothetical protein